MQFSKHIICAIAQSNNQVYSSGVVKYCVPVAARNSSATIYVDWSFTELNQMIHKHGRVVYC